MGPGRCGHAGRGAIQHGPGAKYLLGTVAGGAPVATLRMRSFPTILDDARFVFLLPPRQGKRNNEDMGTQIDPLSG